MHSVADELRKEDREEIWRLSFEERLELSFRLGDEALETFRLARGLDREEALRLLERRRQAGRAPSKCISELIG
jgi:hypothetical protein